MQRLKDYRHFLIDRVSEFHYDDDISKRFIEPYEHADKDLNCFIKSYWKVYGKKETDSGLLVTDALVNCDSEELALDFVNVLSRYAKDIKT